MPVIMQNIKRDPTPTEIVNSYLRDSLNISLENTSTKISNNINKDIKRMSIQSQNKETPTNFIVPSTPTSGHVTIFRPNIENMTVISNFKPPTRIRHKYFTFHIKQKIDEIMMK